MIFQRCHHILVETFDPGGLRSWGIWGGLGRSGEVWGGLGGLGRSGELGGLNSRKNPAAYSLSKCLAFHFTHCSKMVDPEGGYFPEPGGDWGELSQSSGERLGELWQLWESFRSSGKALGALGGLWELWESSGSSGKLLGALGELW